MKKITFLLLLFVSVNIFSQENNRGDRAGTIFYPTIDKTEEVYSISVDLFELRNTKYIEVELLDDNEVRQASKLLELIVKNKKYYIIEKEGEEKAEEDKKEE